MQDYASPHTTKETTRALLGVSGELHVDDWLISKGLWPPRSQNVNDVNCSKFPEICLKEFSHVSSRGQTFWTSSIMVSVILITILINN
jgi:hypothetical protein